MKKKLALIAALTALALQLIMLSHKFSYNKHTPPPADLDRVCGHYGKSTGMSKDNRFAECVHWKSGEKFSVYIK